MIRIITTRALQALATLWFVVTVVFLLARSSGDPASVLAPPSATPAQIDQLRQTLGLNEPLYRQYFSYLGNVVRGDFGDSTSYTQPVAGLVWHAFLKTAELGIAAFAFALVIGVTLGVVSGMRSGGWVDGFVKFVSLLGQSIPSFALGILLILLFGVHLRLVPTSGSDGVTSLILPAITLGAFSLAAFARLTRSAVIEVMNKDQTLFQRTKGLGPLVLVKHVLRNASLPVVTLAGIQLGHLLSATIVVETMFSWPGAGQLVIQAIFARDYALIQGVVLIDTIVFVALLLLVDFSYVVLDPRTRRSSFA